MHVVMILAGAARHDTRVMREAAWLTRAGAQVTVLARSPSGKLEYAEVEDAQILRIPMEGTIARATARRRQRRRYLGRTPNKGLQSEWRHASELLRVAREDSDALRRADGSLPQRLALRAERKVRHRFDSFEETVDERVASFWKSYDEWVHGRTFGVSWRRTLGGVVDDLELAFGPILDVLEPDVVHAHDMHVLGVAVHAAQRARRAGRDVKVVYDAHEYVRGIATHGNTTPRRVAAWAALETEYIGYADEVITVSPHIAEFIQRDHGLERRPTLLMNVPVPRETPGDDVRPSLREACGLAPEVPLAVYSGAVRRVRGVDDVVVALTKVPELHLAVVSVPTAATPQAVETLEMAAAHGVADRVHIVDAVPVADVTAYLSSADMGVVPIHGGWINHEYCLPNKFFECLQAGLPLVVSDRPTIAGYVRSEGIGEVFTAGDPDSIASALRRTLDALPTYRAAVQSSRLREEAHWRRQEAVLRELYERMLGVRLRPEGDGLDHRPLDLHESPTRVRHTSELPVKVGVGPTNHEGWASALRDHLLQTVPGVTVEVTHVGRRRHHPPADIAVSRADYGSRGWQVLRWLDQQRELTHAVWEDGRPLGGEYGGATCLEEARMLAGMDGHGVLWLHVPPSPLLQDHLAELQRIGVTVLTASPDIAEAHGVDLVADPDDVGPAIAAALGLTSVGPETMAPGPGLA